MRFNSVGFALSVGMALIVVLIGFTLLSSAGLAGFSAQDTSMSSTKNVPGGGESDSVGVAVAAVSLSPEEAKLVAAGDALFKGNCAQCHSVNEQVVGPALAGIAKRRPMSWLLPWVKNSSKLVASGDEYAVALFNKFSKQQMPSFAFSDKDITAIVAYINSQEGPAAAAPTVAMVSE